MKPNAFFLIPMLGVCIALNSCGERETAVKRRQTAPAVNVPPSQMTQAAEKLPTDIDHIRKSPSARRDESDIESAMKARCRLMSSQELKSVLDRYDLEKEYDWVFIYIFEDLAGRDPYAFFEYAARLAEGNGLGMGDKKLIEKAVATDRRAVEKWVKDGEIRNRGGFMRTIDTLSVLFPDR